MLVLAEFCWSPLLFHCRWRRLQDWRDSQIGWGLSVVKSCGLVALHVNHLQETISGACLSASCPFVGSPGGTSIQWRHWWWQYNLPMAVSVFIRLPGWPDLSAAEYFLAAGTAKMDTSCCLSTNLFPPGSGKSTPGKPIRPTPANINHSKQKYECRQI